MVSKNKTGQIILNIIFILLTIAALAPFLLLLSSSLSSEEALAQYGYTFWPKSWSFGAYAYLFKSSMKIVRGYGITILVTLIGTLASVTMTIMFAYPLSRKELPFRYGFSFFVFFKGRVSLCNPGCPRTHSVVQAGAYLYDVYPNLPYQKYSVGISGSFPLNEWILCNHDALLLYRKHSGCVGGGRQN